MEQGYRQNQLPGSRATWDDAKHFLNTAKAEFSNQMEKYDMLLQILKDYRDARITIDVVVARMKDLLKGHDPLILMFNTFLPKKELEIKLWDEPP